MPNEEAKAPFRKSCVSCEFLPFHSSLGLLHGAEACVICLTGYTKAKDSTWPWSKWKPNIVYRAGLAAALRVPLAERTDWRKGKPPVGKRVVVRRSLDCSFTARLCPVHGMWQIQNTGVYTDIRLTDEWLPFDQAEEDGGG